MCFNVEFQASGEDIVTLIKRLLLSTAKAFGLFALARRYTRDHLRIVCYHGASLDDEHEFRPSLFISPRVFTQRLKFLREAGYPVLDLKDALVRLDEGRLPHCAVVITIDDGWYGTYSTMAPALQQFGYASTLYVSTYYVDKQSPVFNVAIDYVLWKMQKEGRHAEFSSLDESFIEPRTSSDQLDLQELAERLRRWVTSPENNEERCERFIEICRKAGISWNVFEEKRVASFMNFNQVAELAVFGMDVQLHTHRHHFPQESFDAACAELNDNREALRNYVPGPLNHFCYPSGEYETTQLGWLATMEIESATTTKPGLNDKHTSKYELHRFLDSDTFSQVEFEAELSGFSEVYRKVRRHIS